jgi:hypothetical protein
MYNGNWKNGLEVGLGSRRRIRNTTEAAHFLLYGWHTKRGRAYRVAQDMCLEAIDHRASPEQAKAAFIQAAREAELSIADQ